MGANSTVVFADLTGSTRVFEAMGNARATDTVTRLTQWIGGVCEAHGGRVVKMLGDGVLAIFPAGDIATAAVLAAALDEAVAKRVQTLASSNPEAMAQLKKVFWEGTEGWAEQLESRAAMSGTLVLSDFTSRAVGRTG